MGTWILIIALYKGGIDHIEFNTKEACVAAANEMRERVKGNVGYYAAAVLCTPKGEKK